MDLLERMSSNASREARVSLDVLKEAVEATNFETLGLIPLNIPKSQGLRPKRDLAGPNSAKA